MRRNLVFFLLIGVSAGLLAACSSGGAGPAAAGTKTQVGPTAANAVENYLQGVVSKDVDKVSTLSCKEWEQDAIQELDSLQAVKAALSGVVCTQSGTDGSTSLVNCTGKIVITYDNENQELDLSLRTYRVTQSGGDWQVCGYQQ